MQWVWPFCKKTLCVHLQIQTMYLTQQINLTFQFRRKIFYIILVPFFFSHCFCACWSTTTNMDASAINISFYLFLLSWEQCYFFQIHFHSQCLNWLPQIYLQIVRFMRAFVRPVHLWITYDTPRVFPFCLMCYARYY